MTKSAIHYFGCYSESDMSHWITAFQLVAFKDSVSNQTIEENNDLYCTSGEGVFCVKVVETDASKRCGLESRNYTLVVAAVDIKLMDGDVVLFTWPYRYIRRYGYKDGKFIFEAGRKCESGEGSFRLEHSSQQEIFRCMYSKLRSMKKLMTEENNPSIECNDAQYYAALNMEAGSRAALPPSPNSSANLIDIDFPTPQNSQKQTNSSSNADNSLSSKPSSSLSRAKPTKPPRKYVFAGLLDKKNVDSDSSDLPTCEEYRALNRDNSPELSQKTIGSSLLDDEERSYDLVEVRNDAWKTHGIDTIHHTERPNSLLHGDKDKENEDDLQYETMMASPSSQTLLKSKSTITDSQISASTINHVSSKSNDESDYDKLEHFGSASKISQKGTYKFNNFGASQNSHSNISLNNSVTDTNTAWANYDIVEDMSAVRLADDSHLGYGVIRKKTNHSDSTSASGTIGPKHKVFNNSEYAIVSKPKRV